MVSENDTGSRKDEIIIVTKQYSFKKHSSTKLTSIQASLKKNERYLYQNCLEKGQKLEPKSKTRDLATSVD